jgi:hypothetical protein
MYTAEKEEGMQSDFVKREDLRAVFDQDIRFLEKIGSFLEDLEERKGNSGLNNADGAEYGNVFHAGKVEAEEKRIVFDKERNLKILKMPTNFSRSILNLSRKDIDSGSYNWTIEIKVVNMRAGNRTKTDKLILNDIIEESLVWQVICEKMDIWPVSIHFHPYFDKSGCGFEKRTVEVSDTFKQVLKDASIIEFPTFIIFIE